MAEIDGELICPRTGLECHYFPHCGNLKAVIDAGGYEPGSHDDENLVALKVKVPKVGEIMESEFCSEERGFKLLDLAMSPASSMREQEAARRFAEQELQARMQFPTPTGNA